MNDTRKFLFIINRFAGTGYSSVLEDRIIQSCKKHKIEATLQFTEGPGHATELAGAATKKDVQCVVAVGGDGTLNEVARGLVGTATTMGIVPRGSGNGLARHLYIDLDINRSLETLFTGSMIRMDTFTLNGRLSLNVSGIGFDGHIANLFGGKTRRGLTGYATLTLKEFLRFSEFESVVTTGTETWKFKSFVLAVANSSQYGNNAWIAPGASVTDGLLNLIVLKKVPPYRFDFVYAFFNKTIDQSPYCSMHTGSSFTIETAAPMPYHVDGEPCGEAQKFFISVSPAALQLIVPNKTAEVQTL
jgi:diacylglycerol kinase (ATP)